MNGQVKSERSLHDYWVSLLRLSRWKEHILFTVPATVLGVNMAAETRSVVPDWHVLTVLVANILAVTFAFMINDVEDAPDDARDPARGARNPVTSGEISRRAAWLASIAVSLLALALYAWINRLTFWTGALTIVLAYLYSWRGVRLKARPVIDVISHVLMLSALLFLAGYFAYENVPGSAWWVALAVALISVYGQLYNQLRDYEMDRAARLHNTASILGRAATAWVMYASLALALVCLGISVVLGLWPLWLIAVPVILSPLLIWLRSGTDMRGTTAIDASGRVQLGFMIIANLTVLVWLAALVLG